MCHRSISPTLLRATAALALVLAAGCDSPSGAIVPGGGDGRTVQAVLVSPEATTVQAGSTLQFHADAVLSDGDTADASVDWSATGGTISATGVFTAGQTAGVFRVVATASNGRADTAAVTVTVPSTSPTLVAVVVTPAQTTVAAGGTAQFAAVGQLSNGGTQAVSVTWTASGGSVSGTGLYTAGALPGNYQVVATGPGGLADTAAVTITGPGTPAPTLTAIVVTPATASLVAGGAQQFSAVGQLSNGGTQAVTVTWSATGGTISGAGLYTAGSTAGSYRVIATGPGGMADTSAVTVTAAPAGSSYTRVVGDDWKYASKAELRAQDLFWWPEQTDVYNYVDLVPDPVFGQVVRITQPVNSGVTAPTPRMEKSFPAPLDKMWYRWRMRYHPGWTSVGPDPAGHANSYKIGFWGWRNYYSRGEVGLTNSDEYYVGFSVQNPSTGAFIQYAETKLNAAQGNGLGRVTTDWTDNQWYEFVVYYERTSTTSARQHWWKRRLTTNGAIAPGPWTYLGIGVSGGPTPQVDRVELGINKNKSTPREQYIYWGPWEVVDGSRFPNPWNMPLP